MQLWQAHNTWWLKLFFSRKWCNHFEVRKWRNPFVVTHSKIVRALPWALESGLLSARLPPTVFSDSHQVREEHPAPMTPPFTSLRPHRGSRRNSLARSGSSWGSRWDLGQPGPDAWWRGAGRSPHRWARCGWHHLQSPAQCLGDSCARQVTRGAGVWSLTGLVEGGFLTLLFERKEGIW